RQTRRQQREGRPAVSSELQKARRGQPRRAPGAQRELSSRVSASLCVLCVLCGSLFAASPQSPASGPRPPGRSPQAPGSSPRSEPDGTTPLHWAAQRNDLEAADRLIRSGANVKAANRYGITALQVAATNGSAPMIETLLSAGADPNTATPEGETVLMTAART